MCLLNLWLPEFQQGPESWMRDPLLPLLQQGPQLWMLDPSLQLLPLPPYYKRILASLGDLSRIFDPLDPVSQWHQ